MSHEHNFVAARVTFPDGKILLGEHCEQCKQPSPRTIESHAAQRPTKLASWSDEDWQAHSIVFQTRPTDPNVSVQFVIYDHPADMPNHWVVRRWETNHKTGKVIDHEALGYHSLEDARTSIPPWCTRIKRHPSDNLSVHEIWI